MNFVLVILRFILGIHEEDLHQCQLSTRPPLRRPLAPLHQLWRGIGLGSRSRMVGVAYTSMLVAPDSAS